METKMIRVPFEVELAKKITEKSVDGKIVTRDGRSARVICWDFRNIQNIVSAISQEDGGENVSYNFHDGTCCLSSKCDEDLFIEIPEYMTFKDGDVLVSYEGVILLFDGTVNQYDLCGCYCSLYCDSHDLDLNYDYKGVFHETRKANENERNEMINKLKASKEPKAKEYLKRFFGIEVKQEYEFKPFDKVLVRDLDFNIWYNDIFSFRDKDGRYMCIGNKWDECIPYNEETAHLLGTTDNFEDNK